MDNISFLIIWGLIFFVLPRMFGKKNKKTKPYNYPDENMNNVEVEKTQDDANPWLTWGLPQEEPLDVAKPVAVPVVEKSVLKQNRSERLTQQNVITAAMKNDKPKKKFSHDEIRRGIVLAEILGKPRALKPYNDKF